jgi:hypothetical protein
MTTPAGFRQPVGELKLRQFASFQSWTVPSWLYWRKGQPSQNRLSYNEAPTGLSRFAVYEGVACVTDT